MEIVVCPWYGSSSKAVFHEYPLCRLRHIDLNLTSKIYNLCDFDEVTYLWTYHTYLNKGLNEKMQWATYYTVERESKLLHLALRVQWLRKCSLWPMTWCHINPTLFSLYLVSLLLQFPVAITMNSWWLMSHLLSSPIKTSKVLELKGNLNNYLL